MFPYLTIYLLNKIVDFKCMFLLGATHILTLFNDTTGQMK
jgi:hypothetical protein